MPIADVQPDPPTSFLRNDATTSKTQVSFSWSAPANDGGDTVIDYAIEMDANDDGNFSEVESGVTSTSHTQTGLSAGNSYKFRVRARNGVGQSTYSSSFAIIAAQKPDEPTTFIRDEVSTTKTQVSFSWSGPVENGGLAVIDYSIDMDNNIVATGITSTSYTQTGLSVGTSYTFRVKSRNAIDFSEYSQVFTIIAAVKPDEPTTFVRDESTTTKTQVAFSWTAPSENGGTSVIDYAIEMDSNNSGSYTEV